jgi:Protein of unknown function (DUF1232)
MTDKGRDWAFRTPSATLTGVFRSPAFLNSRKRAEAIMDDPAALRELADQVESLDHKNPALLAIWDRVTVAIHLLRAKASGIEAEKQERADLRGTAPAGDVQPRLAAGRVARERLIVAALHYLVTPVDLIPDFRAGGYIDDALLLSWVFGAAVNELDPFLVDPPTS